MKKILLFLSIIILCSCTNKTFFDVMNEYNLDVVLDSEHSSENTIYLVNNDDFNIRYEEVKSSKEAKNIFTTLKNYSDMYKNGEDEEIETISNNKYILQTDTNYIVIIRKGKKIIYINGDIESKEKIDEIINNF